MKLNSKFFVLIIVIVLLIPSYVFSAGNVPVYKFGIDAACPPWTWVEKGEVLGFDRELIDFICQEEGFEVEWTDIPWSTIISATSQGKIDILGGGLSFTFERAEIIDYARVHFKIGTHALARKDSTLTAENVFTNGNKIASQAGSTEYKWVQEELKDKGADIELVGYESWDDAISDLETGRIQAVVMNQPQAVAYSEKRDVKIVAEDLFVDLIAYAVTPGDPYNLIPKLERGIKKAYDSGLWAKLVEKYMPWSKVEEVPYPADLQQK